MAIVLLGNLSGRAAENQDRAVLDLFEAKIRPVLIARCYECHSQEGDEIHGGLLLDTRAAIRAGGDSGPAVVPGKPDESLLLSALRHDDFEMPPDAKLDDAVIADFTRWIEAGAHDPRDDDGATPIAQSIDIEAGRQHWSYQLPREHKPPHVSDSEWSQNAIDRFVLHRLEQQGWAPAGSATPNVLIRRLYYDLIGLPPTPEQIDEFVSDPTQQNYEAIVDRLLDSPRFGERWARHWLDVARYGESNTLRGTVFGEAWRYRDWAIDAFNEDLPFDQFIQQQIAGDLLEAETSEQRRKQLTATTLLALGNTNFENQDKEQLRMDVVDEQLETVGGAFLAQTITCARCHDHKFDPIPTADYYALAGIFRNTRTLVDANVSRWIEVSLPAPPEVENKIQLHQEQVAAKRAEIAAIREELMPSTATRQTKTSGPVRAESLAGIVVDNTDAFVVGAWKESQFAKPYVGASYIHDEAMDRGEKSISYEVPVPKDGEYEVRISYTVGSNRASNVPVAVTSAGGKEAQVVVDQRKAPGIDGLFHAIGRFPFKANEAAQIVISNQGADGHVIADAVQLVPLDESQSPRPAKVAKQPEKQQEKQQENQQQTAALKTKLKQLEEELKRLQGDAPRREQVMSVQERGEIENSPIHIRGNVHNLGSVAPRGFLQVATYGEPPQFNDQQSGRRELAEWIASDRNPLTARVAVNRFWHWLFGAGLVRTTDNFGSVGELPSHPELLDYLAVQFQKENWSVKTTIKRMVCSRTYQMSSQAKKPQVVAQQVVAEADPENRLLWRANRRRHDAESLRDTILSVSGRLSLEMYGPTYRKGMGNDYDYRYDGLRRSVYVPAFRNSMPEIFEVFDFANPSMVVGTRTTSTVAPQALFMMNNRFVVEESDEAAKRLLKETSDATDEQRLVLAYRRTLGRTPTPREQEISLKFLTDHDADQQQQAWSSLFQAMFASIDFRYLD
ncbi:MAG: DUF1553 domain-containing protein [Pirellulales bacterium]